MTHVKNERFIHSFQVVLPPNHLPQAQLVDWTLSAHLRAESFKGSISDPEKFVNTLRRFTLGEAHISERYFEIDEIDEEWEAHRIYRLGPATPNGATIEERGEYFAERAEGVFRQLYENKTGGKAPHHIVHVTCTGYVSPSPAQIYFSKRAYAPAITHAYHMGCYASLPAVRMAVGLSLSEGKTIDVVHTEMCSLHLNAGSHTPEQMVVQTLFSDGHIKYSVGESAAGMKILAVHEKIVPGTLGDMTWTPGSHGMKMTLSRDVPFKIRDSLSVFLEELCAKAGVDKEEALKHGVFAVHPGGPKIIEAVQKELGLSDEQVRLSQKVLFTRGNMSSATLPHVWNEILESKPAAGTKVFSFAFGPGLTLFGSVFTVCA